MFLLKKKFKVLVLAVVAVLSLFCAALLAGCSEKEFVGFTYTLNAAGTGYVFGCDGTYPQSELVIPAEYQGLPIVEVQSKAFRKNTHIQSVTFESNGKLLIGDKAFDSCTELKTLTFTGECEVEIGESTFYSCTFTTLNVGKAVLKFSSGANNVTVQGGSVKNLSVGGALTVSNGTKLNIVSEQAPQSLTVTDDLFYSGTSISHFYQTGFFKIVDHYGPAAENIYLPETLTHIPAAFFGNEGSCTVYYDGMREDWNKVYIETENNELYQSGGVTVLCKEDRSYTVKFVDINDVEVAAARTVKYGNKIPEVTAVNRNGYTFMGWCTKKDYTERWDAENDLVTGDLTLYAGYLDNSHEHNYTTEVIDSTCTERGYTLYTCDCVLGNKIDDYVDALGHDYDYGYDKIEWSDWSEDFKCTATLTCKRAGCTESTHEHVKTFEASITSNETKAATCQEEGKAIYSAWITDGSVDYPNATTKERVLPKLPHKIVSDENGEEATCTAAGWTSSTHCEDCSEVISEREKIEKLGHDVVIDSAVTATCTRTGLTQGSHCARCGVVISEQQLTPMAEHNDADQNGMCDSCGVIDTNTATEINSLEGLRGIVNKLTGIYYLSADISLEGENWLPIGTQEAPFSGILYGNGHTVSGLSLSGTKAGGLFAYNSGTISSLTIADFNLVVNRETNNGTWVAGGIAAYNNGSIVNCTLTGSNTIKGNAGFSIDTSGQLAKNETHNYIVIMGGIVGVNNSSITNCVVSGSVTAAFENYAAYSHKVGLYTQGTSDYAESNATFYFGCIAGSNKGMIDACRVTGTSTASVKSVTNLRHDDWYIGQARANTIAYIGSIVGENVMNGTVRATVAKATVITSSTDGSYSNGGYKIATPKVTVYTDTTYQGLIGVNKGKLTSVNFL